MLIFNKNFKPNPIRVVSQERERLFEYHKEIYKQFGFTPWRKIENNSIVYMSMTEFYSLYRIDRDKINGSYVIHSTSSPLDVYQEITLDRVKYVINDLNLKYVHAHKSSHATPSDIETFIDTIKPEFVIPIHTEKAENSLIKNN